MRWLRGLGIALLVALIGIGLRLALDPELRESAQPPEPDGVVIGVGGAAAPEPGEAPAPETRRRRRPAPPRDAPVDPTAPEEAGEVRGRVLVQRGDETLGVAGAAIRVYRETVDDQGWGGLRLDVVDPDETVRSDSDGWFRFAVEPEERWRVRVRTADGLGMYESGEGPDEIEVWVMEPERAVLRVVDEHERPLPGASAYLYTSSDDTPPYERVDADADGRITLDRSPGDAVVTAPGHGFVHVSSPEGDELIVLSRGFDTAGRVIDETGQPLAGVHLYVDDADFTREVVSGPDGAFRFERLAPDELVWVTVLLEDGSQVSRTIPFGEQDALIEITRGGDVAGVVLMPDGTPAQRARVDGAETPDGRFRLWSDQDEDVWWLNAEMKGPVEDFGTVRTHFVGQLVELQPGRTVEVRLVLEELPRSFAAVRLTGPDDGTLAHRNVHCAGKGSIQQVAGDRVLFFCNEAPGTEVTVTMTPHDAAFAPVTATVVTSAAWDTSVVELRTERNRPTRVRLFDVDGDEIPFQEWTRFEASGVGYVSKLEGAFLNGPSGGAANVVVEARGRTLRRFVLLQAKPPHELRLRFPRTCRVTGRLVRADGRPAAGLGVVVVPQSALATGDYLRDTTSGDGTFTVDDVPSGSGWLYAWNEGDEVLAHARQLDVPAEGELDLGQLHAWAPVVARGRVSVPDGDAAGGIRVEILWDDGRHDEGATTDADGSFELTVPGTPDAVLIATRAGKLRGVRTIDLSRDTRADVRLLRSGRIRLLTTREWRNAGFDLWLVSADRGLRWDPTTTWPGNSEHVYVDDVPAGSWIVEVTRQGETTEYRVDVPAGALVDLQIAR
jgi:hypothetical protein